ncbi:MAG: dihydrofolate reductase [Bacteroidales bacterium]|nr:dihydrofolate reductase [Bacteroidales bacterium]
MTISIIAAIAENNVIGKDNDLIWHISEDLKRFKKLTSGHSIIMGRKTYESLPFKPLPNRKNIVISSQKNLILEGAVVVQSPEEAVKICEGEKEVFICGGATIYNHFINIANKMYITKVHHKFDGDTFFPEYTENDWRIESQSKKKYDKKSDLYFSFIDYIKQKQEQ